MALTNINIIEAIEISLFLLPLLSGRLERVTIPGIRGRISTLSHPLLNLVGAATLTPENVDATIREVCDLFTVQRKAFGWLVGPYTTPADLGARLRAAGLVKTDDVVGMVLTDLSIPIQSNPAVYIREATADDVVRASRMMAHAYGLPEDVARLMNEAILQGEGGMEPHAYLAYLDGCDEPVAFSYLYYIPDQPIVLLGGAATLEQARGYGVYTSLVARRLADARAHGSEAAIIQAVRSTSAPICKKIGFSAVGDMELYTWTPTL